MLCCVTTRVTQRYKLRNISPVTMENMDDCHYKWEPDAATANQHLALSVVRTEEYDVYVVAC